MRKTLSMFLFGLCIVSLSAQSVKKEMLIQKKYLNIPVKASQARALLALSAAGIENRELLLKLSDGQPDYWVFLDVSDLKGKRITLTYPRAVKGWEMIYQDDQITGSDSLYHESRRPWIHFTTRRGWINDPNGMIFYEGEYHLFYQHNPMEWDWENMCWGHAVSTDLIHWKELPVVMYPDKLGTIFSGSTVIDYQNTSGFGKEGIPPMVAIYTVASSDNQRQCLAYSLDKGRTFIKYPGNPVVDSKVKWQSVDLRDPKVFWYEPSKAWVMVLFEKDGNSIYTSHNLKDWHYESHTPGFFECPQFFELMVDGNPQNRKWVMYGASGTYMVGRFDGKTFTPEGGKYAYGHGALYAAQTFENMPAADGRRIQIGWGRIPQPGMPFNNMMLLPTEMSLKTTQEGVRLINSPIREMDQLQDKMYTWENLNTSKASEVMQQFENTPALRIKTTLHLTYSTDAGLKLNGQEILRYDLNFNTVNDAFYTPEERTSMDIRADIFIDKTSVEVFIDGGAYSFSLERKTIGNVKGFQFFGNETEVKNLTVYTLKSIWN